MQMAMSSDEVDDSTVEISLDEIIQIREKFKWSFFVVGKFIIIKEILMHLSFQIRLNGVQGGLKLMGDFLRICTEFGQGVR